MSHTFRFVPDDEEDMRNVRRMRSDYNQREDRKIEAMLRRTTEQEDRT